MNVAAKRPTTARLRNASPVVLPIPQMSCNPVPLVAEQAVAHQRQGVGQRQYLGERGQDSRQGTDRE